MASKRKRGRVQFEEVKRPKLADHDSTVLDLAFALDCTASMKRYIREAQQNIRHIVETIVAKEKSDIHLALVEYRDHPPQDHTYVTQVHDFTPSVKKMKTWLDASHAAGGGDLPEAVADAWHAVLKLNWRPAATKICVHIADAPPHGLADRRDGFPNGCPDGLDPVAIMHQLAEKGVTLYMCGCEPAINMYRNFYMAMAHITGGQYVPLTNAKLLTQVIIGSAEEELSLEQLMAEVQDEVQQEVQAHGEDLDEEKLSKKVHAKLATKGVKSKQLSRGKASMPKTPAWARDMSKQTSLVGVRSALKKKGLLKKDRSPVAVRAGSTGKASRAISPRKKGKVTQKKGSKKKATLKGRRKKGDDEPEEDYETREDIVNLEQTRRMVQKARKRKK